MSAPSARKTTSESAREIEVTREADVVVVGGGPGGIGSALAAARGGADTVDKRSILKIGGIKAHFSKCFSIREFSALPIRSCYVNFQEFVLIFNGILL